MSEITVRQCDLCYYTLDPRDNPSWTDVIETVSLDFPHPEVKRLIKKDACHTCTYRLYKGLIDTISDIRRGVYLPPEDM